MVLVRWLRMFLKFVVKIVGGVDRNEDGMEKSKFRVRKLSFYI